MGWGPVNLVITIGSYVFAVGILLFLVNVWRSWRRGVRAGPNPWDASTLEWATSSPPPSYNFRVIPTVASRHPLWEDRMTGIAGRSSVEEGLLLDQGRETIGTTVLDAEPDVILRMPEDSFAPLLFAIALSLSFVGLLLHSWSLAIVAAVLSALALIAWLWPEAKLGQTMEIARG